MTSVDTNPAIDVRPSVPPEYEAIAAKLEEHARALRDLGRYGANALGEGETVYDALWGISDALVDVERDIDAIAERLANEEDRAQEGATP